MDISIKLKDSFYRLVAFGLGVTYIFQVFLTIGGGSKFIPLTGVTLPLISYGGSSVFTTVIMFSIIEGLCMVKQDEEKERYVAKKRAKAGRKEKTGKKEKDVKKEKTQKKENFRMADRKIKDWNESEEE